MAALSDTQKTRIITLLACFRTPSEVRSELQETWGLDVPLSSIMYYDPGTAQGGKELAAEWRTLFAQTRERFLADVSAIPIANQAYRLMRLQRIIDDPRYSKNPKLVAEIVEQGAKEAGGSYTNRRELSGPDGKAISVKHEFPDADKLRDMAPDELLRIHKETLGAPGEDR